MNTNGGSSYSYSYNMNRPGRMENISIIRYEFNCYFLFLFFYDIILIIKAALKEFNDF